MRVSNEESAAATRHTLGRSADLESHMTEKPVKPAAKRPRTRKAKTRPREPSHTEISERAYYIHLEDPASDQLRNWLRAERELAAA
jgi:hypothetical protein